MNKGKQTRFRTSWLDESEYLRQCDGSKTLNIAAENGMGYVWIGDFGNYVHS